MKKTSTRDWPKKISTIKGVYNVGSGQRSKNWNDCFQANVRATSVDVCMNHSPNDHLCSFNRTILIHLLFWTFSYMLLDLEMKCSKRQTEAKTWTSNTSCGMTKNSVYTRGYWKKMYYGFLHTLRSLLLTLTETEWKRSIYNWEIKNLLFFLFHSSKLTKLTEAFLVHFNSNPFLSD